MNIAIVGATGLVGREIINLCEEFLPKDTIYTLFASSKSAGKKLKVNGKDYEVRTSKTFSYSLSIDDNSTFDKGNYIWFCRFCLC